MGFLLKPTQGRHLSFRQTNSRSKKLLTHGPMSPLHLQQVCISTIIFLLDSTPTRWLTLFQFRSLSHLDYHLVPDPNISIPHLFSKVLVKLDPKPIRLRITDRWNQSLEFICPFLAVDRTIWDPPFGRTPLSVAQIKRATPKTH